MLQPTEPPGWGWTGSFQRTGFQAVLRGDTGTTIEDEKEARAGLQAIKLHFYVFYVLEICLMLNTYF